MSRASWLGNFAQWGSFVAATLAVAFTGVNAYYSVFWQQEELRVEVDTWPKHEVNLETKHLYVEGAMGVVFINAGNRPLAILSSEIILEEKRGLASYPRKMECDGVSLTTNMEAFVLKENEIVRKIFWPRIDESKKQPVLQVSDRRIELQNEVALEPMGGESYVSTMCVYFRGTSPTEYTFKGIVHGWTIFRWMEGKGGTSIARTDGPWVIFRKTLSPLMNWL